MKRKHANGHFILDYDIADPIIIQIAFEGGFMLIFEGKYMCTWRNLLVRVHQRAPRNPRPYH